MKPDVDPFVRAWVRAFEAEQVSRAELGWVMVGVLLLAAVVIAFLTLRWISRGGLRRSAVARFSVR